LHDYYDHALTAVLMHILAVLFVFLESIIKRMKAVFNSLVLIYLTVLICLIVTNSLTH